jgi:3',5'-cyclic AMP phosphodiesterase CpdA
MFRLAHISDIHLGLEHIPSIRELASKRITGYVNWRRKRRKALFGEVLETLVDDISSRKPDHLAITGDMVNLATDNEVDVALTWLDAVAEGMDMSLVPGNHDAYVPGAYDKVAVAWRHHMISDDKAHVRPDNGLFPFMRVRKNVALIGISTATATPPFVASGYFGIPQARRTVEMLKSAREQGLFRVVMIHHPPVRRAAIWHKRMIGIGRFAKVLREAGAELVIHGHTHLNTIYWLPSSDGVVPVVGIASASQGPGGDKPTATYNLFSISGRPEKWKCRLERFQLREDGGEGTVRISDDLLSEPETVPPRAIPPELGQDRPVGLLGSIGEAIGERRHDSQAAEDASAEEPDQTR